VALPEIYVELFPPTGAKWRVSRNGGAQVRWGAGGREVHFIAPDGRLVSVPLRISADGRAAEAGSPQVLFPARLAGTVEGSERQQYVVAPDGSQFLVNTVSAEATSPITLILNWRKGSEQVKPRSGGYFLSPQRRGARRRQR
jgi:hypothetical protein